MKKLYLFLMAMIVAVTAGAANWYLVGSSFELPTGKFTSKWADDAKCMFTPSADDANIQTLDFVSIDGDFKIKEAGTWSTSMSADSSNSAIKVGTVYNAGTDGGNIPVDGSLKNGTITIDTAKRTILITGESQGNEYTTVYIVGDINGSGWNEALTTFPLALKDGSQNEWVGTYEITNATSYLKFRAGNKVYGTGGADIAIELDKTYTAAMSGNAFSLVKGKYDFTYVLDYNAPTGKLTVKSAGVEPPTPPTTEYPELYVRGAFNNNVADATSKMTEANGVYTITLDKLTGNFKIADGEWTEQYSTKNTAMVLGTAYTMLDASGLGGDMAIEGAATNVTLTFDYKAMTLKVEGTPYEPVVGYKINSDLTVATWSMAEMTAANGLYTYTVTPAQATGQMQVVKTLDGTATDYMGSEATISEENNEVTMAAGASNLKYSLSAGTEYTFTFDPATSKLSVEKATVPPTPPTPEYPVLYVRGAFNNNVADATSKLTVADGVYTITLDKLTGNFKIADGEWTEQYSTKNTAMALGTAYTMLDASGLGGDMAIEGAATNVTLTFDYKAMTLKVEGTPYEPVVGYKINSDLTVATWSMAEMTAANGLYTYTVTPAQATGQMQVVKTLDGTATDYMGSEATISEENNEVTMAVGASNLKYSLTAGESYTFTFDPTTSKLSVAKATVPPTPEYPVLYVRGAFNNNVVDATSKLTVADGVYTITLDKLTGNFKIADEEWTEQYSTKNTAMALGTAYDMLDASGLGGDMAIEGAATNVTLTFNYKAMTLKVEGTPYEPVVGYKINSDLTVATWSMAEMTEADGLYTYTVTPAQAEGQMQVVKTLDGTATDYMGSDATISEENNEVTMAAGASNLKYSLTAGESYTFTFDPATSKLSVAKATVPPTPEMPEHLYLIGNVNGNGWNTATPVEMTKEGNKFVATNVLLDNAGEDVSYFSFVTLTGENWNAVNEGDRYGAIAKDAPLAVNETAEMKLFAAGVDASSAFSWKVAYTAGGVDIEADFETMTVSIKTNTGIEAVQGGKNIKVFGGMISVEGAEQVAVYSTNGALVSRAAETQLPAGLYIVVVDGAATKVLVK